MRGNSSQRGTAVAARFAGLGVATTLALALGTVPATALAEDVTTGGEAPAVSESATEEPANDAGAPAESAPAGAVAATQAPSQAADTSDEAPAPVAPASHVAPTVEEAAPVAPASGEKAASGTSETASEIGQQTPEAAEKPADAARAASNPKTSDGTTDTVSAAEGAPKSSASSSATEVAPAKAPAPAKAATASKTASKPAQATATYTSTAAAQTPSKTPATYTNVYRLYNPNSGEHFYTTSLGEATSVFSKGWHWEEAAYLEADKAHGTPVYRLYNPNAGAHFYTTSQVESNHLRSLGWRYENIAFYASGTSLLYRLYNPNSPIGEHLYTASLAESNHLRSIGWRYENYAWAFTPGRHKITGQWVVSPAYGSEERYWVSSDTSLAKNRYIEKSEGSGWRAYAKASGAVVRGFYQTSATTGLIADNKGALETTSNGMLSTGKYTNGVAQYYYLKNGYVQLGRFSVNGKDYFGRYDTGYVVRGDYFDPNAGKMYRGNNDGVLQARNSRIDRYVDWALAIAKDESHGYSQINRWGPNYDCSSMVISALRQAGYATGGATYTGNMYSSLSNYGWYSVAPSAGNLRYGDILLNDTHHTAIYLANGWLVQASSDENGSWEGYRSGDQTGREIWYRSYYNYPWNRFLRHV